MLYKPDISDISGIVNNPENLENTDVLYNQDIVVVHPDSVENPTILVYTDILYNPDIEDKTEIVYYKT